MKNTASHAEPHSEPGFTAWAISGVFHLSAILLMALAIGDVPRGAANIAADSPGIVLELDTAEGEHFDGHDGTGDSAVVIEVISPPELFAPPPSEPRVADARPEPAPTAAVQPATARIEQLNPAPQSPSNAAASALASTTPRTSIFAADIGRQGSPAGRGYAHVRVFGVEGRGNKFVYAFDRSASMEGAPMAAAKRQLIDSLGSLESVHQFHIIFFNHRLQAFDITGGGRRIAFGSDRNKQLAANFVGGITAEGGTDRYAALKAALAFRPDVIFFLTDADDPMSASELDDIDRTCQSAGSSICVIEFGRQSAPARENFLHALARQSGGQYGYVNTTRLAR